eukprot:871152-Rhodomonas_salina.2
MPGLEITVLVMYAVLCTGAFALGLITLRARVQWFHARKQTEALQQAEHTTAVVMDRTHPDCVP